MCVACDVRLSRRDVLKMTAGAAALATLPLSDLWAAPRGFSDYRAVFQTARAEDGRHLFITRRFTYNGERLTLTVDPVTLETKIRPDSWLGEDDLGWDEQSETPYLSALQALTNPPTPTENAGLTHARGTVDGVFLTIDMCPSHKPFESRFFASLAARARRDERAMPVAISISGYWALEHEAEFATLIEMQKRGELDIIWTNHSYTHRYVKGLPDAQNFMLMAHTDFEQEVLLTEQLLVAKGLTPSVFFRFPGLVSDDYLLMETRRLSLLPLGADAWLAKGKRPKRGSIVLVHGNGNEPLGIRDVKPYIADPKLRWLNLREAVA